MPAETTPVLLIVVLAAAAVALGAWALSLRDRLQRMGRELAEAREQLSRLRKLASLGEMAAGFAHAFNDVLTPIIGRTQLLSQRITDPQLQEWLATIERSALDAAQMVRKIQEFMRLRLAEPGVMVELTQVVRQAITTAASSYRPGVHVTTELDEVPPIAGDPVALREAVAHLIVNAIEASPDGGTVTIATWTEGEDAVVSVTDTGMGMTPGVQARIFEPFFTTKPEAAGLGLNLAQGIVARHGGQIEVDSLLGRGTTVRVRLPAQPGARPGPERARPARALGGPARCLVVDDDPQVREMIRDVLSNAGHEVVVAVDGSDGVEKFKNEGAFDVVITDLAMPKLNGLQLARVCKTLRPAVPLVMLTGWGVLLTEEELAEHGVDEVLSKPVRMNQVLSAVAAVRQRAAATSTEELA